MDEPLSTGRGKSDSFGAPMDSADPNAMDEDEVYDNEFIILVPDEFMGCVLGRGGATIRRLQWQTHTTIRVSNADEPFYPGTNFRLVTIISSSTAAMDAAQQLILLQIAQNYSKSFREVACVVPDDMAGRVIGKGGGEKDVERIRHGLLRTNQTNSPLPTPHPPNLVLASTDRIQEIRNCCQHAELANRGEGAQGERIMTVQGNVAQVTKALRMVVDLIFHE
ncbi:hypothetical protein TL16_g11995 [Triparma laevis f. inornata]|uniref:K Homology domain-containing protein n=1 Tax=Triparma laevis f. inornata TaxID=1714386 RepID=A0A9W7BIS0_9STRA|nr:hypothetical protein TL16_g11995 [Triparma laevis f. inornata]